MNERGLQSPFSTNSQACLRGETPKKKIGFRRSELNVVNIRQKPKVRKKEQVTEKSPTPELLWL